jgi:hypothetical protein
MNFVIGSSTSTSEKGEDRILWIDTICIHNGSNKRTRTPSSIDGENTSSTNVVIESMKKLEEESIQDTYRKPKA